MWNLGGKCFGNSWNQVSVVQDHSMVQSTTSNYVVAVVALIVEMNSPDYKVKAHSSRTVIAG